MSQSSFQRRSRRSCLLRIGSLLLLGLWNAGLPAAFAAPQALRVGIYGNPPKIFVNSSGQATGIFIDLLARMADEEGWRLRFIPCEWSDCLGMLGRGEIDILPDVAYTEERARLFAFHSVPALLSWSQIYRGPGIKVDSILDLQGKRIAVVDGSVQSGFLASLFSTYRLTPIIVRAISFTQAFEFVHEGKADMVAANNFYGDRWASSYGLNDTPIVFQPARLFYAARPGLRPEILAAVDRHLSHWQNNPDSIYFSTLKHWQLKVPGQKLSDRALWLLGLLAAAMLMAVVTATRFRRQVAQRTSELHDTESKWSLIVDRVESLIYIKDEQFRYRYVNNAFCRMLGRPASEILGKDDFELYGSEQAASLRANDEKTISNGQQNLFEEPVNVAGTERIYLSTKLALVLEKGEARYLCGISSDISSRKRMEESTRIAATMFQSYEGMLVLDAGRRVLNANPAFCAMSGYSLEELTGSSTLPFMLAEEGAFLDKDFWAMLAACHKWHGSATCYRKDDTTCPVLLSVSTVLDEEQRIANYVCTASDITELKQTQERNLRLAYYDELTGLPNRRLLFERIQSCLADADDETKYGALLFLDLDNFKDLNDTRGHIAGDNLLVQVAERLLACVRGEDTVARLGGDEFVIMFDAIGADEAEARLNAELLAEKVLGAVRAPYLIDGLPHHASCSIGVTLCAHRDEALDQLMKRGDLAMYQAKAEGRNAVRMFEDWMEQSVTQRIRLEAELRHALAVGQFTLYYQPQVEGNRIIGAEALLRWRHPERGVIGPGEFIGVAEKSELILPIGAWVLRAGCEELARWARSESTAHLTMAINISIRQLMEDNFVRDTLAVITATRADPARLKLEVTESMVIDHVEDTIAKMEELRRFGVRFSLDDFGTGYSSLVYLKRLPLEQLKIDRAFVHDIVVNMNDASIARSIVALANTLGLSIIAEGVETDSQWQVLQKLGCNRYQGYLCSMPVPAEEFMSIAAANFCSQ